MNDDFLLSVVVLGMVFILVLFISTVIVGVIYLMLVYMFHFEIGKMLLIILSTSVLLLTGCSVYWKISKS